MKKNKKIKVLKFDGNNITDSGVKLLSLGLVNSSIRILDLSLNKLTEKSVPFLNTICLNNEKIQKIKIVQNQIKIQFKDKIKDGFKKIGIFCVV